VVIGVTGGMATGKTTVARMFAKLGAELVSADEIAREVLSVESSVLARVAERFGSDLLLPDGTVDRSRLAAIIFSDPKAREDLNSIMHPEIITRLQRRIERFREFQDADRRVMVAEIPLLFECGLQSLADKVVVVAAEQGTQEDRLISRDRLSREQALARIASQMSLEDKVACADWVVWTDSGEEHTERQVRDIWSEIADGLQVG